MKEQLFDFIAKYMPLTDEEKQAIRELDIFRSYKKGTILLKEGEKTKDSYFVLNGCLRSYFIIDGEERTTEFFTESEGITPLASVNQAPSEYYIACVEDCALLVANADMERVIFEKFPRFETLCRLLSEDLLAKNQATINNFKTSTPEQRYIQLLNARPDLVKRVPQYQLASYLGIKRESLSRIRKRLQLQEKN